VHLRPATWPWLLAHEIRLAWRGFFSDKSDLMLLLIGLLWVVLHVPAYFLMRDATPDVLSGFGIVIAGLIFWFAFTLMLSSAVVLSVNALYDRGDLDLLISSPLPTSTVFTVRGLGVAVSSAAMFLAFATPFAHMGIVHGHLGFIAIYPVLAGVALGAAALGLVLTLVLARLFGARRARVIGQVLSALIGASIFMLLQSPNFVSDEVRAAWMPRIIAALSSDWLAPDSPLWWPIRGLFGAALPVLGTLIAGTAAFAVVIGVTSKAFVTGTQESTTKPARHGKAQGEIRFRPGLARNIVRKELLLIRRDPNLIAKTLLQALYLLPLLFIIGRNDQLLFLEALPSAMILLLAGVAGNLAWITIAAEEAPDLIGSAPVDREKIRWLKAAAALMPVAFVAAPFVAFYLFRAPRLGLGFAVFLSLGLLASAVTQVWGGKPSSQRDLKQRQKQNVGLNFAELIGTVAIAAACYLTLTRSWGGLAVLPVGLLAPGIAWVMRRRDAV
jgi:ABC-2 type transport system permease protein